MFRFTIRDLLWLMVVVAMGAFAYREQLTAQEARRGAASLTKALADERAKPMTVTIGGYNSTNLKPGESVVVSIAKDGRSSSFRPIRVDQLKILETHKQPQP
jgi:hypothetical protein